MAADMLAEILKAMDPPPDVAWVGSGMMPVFKIECELNMLKRANPWHGVLPDEPEWIEDRYRDVPKLYYWQKTEIKEAGNGSVVAN